MKLFITGIVASGKTTLARSLSSELDIPYFELDCIVHGGSGESRHKRTPEEQVAMIRDIDQNGDWIIEGTYRKSCHVLFELADTVLFLDTPLWKRRYRILMRYIKQQLRIEKCHYKSDLKMLGMMYKWTRDFEDQRPEFVKMLHESSRNLIIATDVNKAINRIIKR